MHFLKSPRVLLALAIVVVLLVVALWPSARLVDTGVADRGEVRQTFDAEGRTRLVDRYVLSAPVVATARRLEMHPGDPVRAGQPLVVLDPAASAPLDPRNRASAEAGVAAARARLASAEEQQHAAEASAAQALADEERLQALAAQRLVAADQAERARTQRILAERALDSARFARATAAHELDMAQAALRFGEGKGDAGKAMTLLAPVSGVLVRRHFESARPVQPGEALLEIGDPARLEAEIEVLSADAVRLREGMAVELLRWGEAQPLQGRVSRIEPGGYTKFSALGVEEQRVWVIVDLLSPPEEWQRLGDAYRVNARFILSRVEDAVRVPTSAVFRHGDGHAVFRADGRRARLTPVRVGLQGGGYTEVAEGLAPGTIVVVHPDRTLEDGDPVRGR